MSHKNRVYNKLFGNKAEEQKQEQPAANTPPVEASNDPEIKEQEDQPAPKKSVGNSYGAILEEARRKRKARIQRLKDEQK